MSGNLADRAAPLSVAPDELRSIFAPVTNRDRRLAPLHRMLRAKPRQGKKRGGGRKGTTARTYKVVCYS